MLILIQRGMQKLSHYSKINFIACDFSTLYVKKKKSMVKYQVSMSGCEEKMVFPSFLVLICFVP